MSIDPSNHNLIEVAKNLPPSAVRVLLSFIDPEDLEAVEKVQALSKVITDLNGHNTAQSSLELHDISLERLEINDILGTEKLVEMIQDVSLRSIVFRGISRAWLNKNNIPKALEAARKVVNDLSRSIDLFAIVKVLLKEENADEAFEIAQEITDVSFKNGSLREVAELYVKKGEKHQAIRAAYRISDVKMQARTIKEIYSNPNADSFSIVLS